MKTQAIVFTFCAALLMLGGCYNPDLGQNPFLCADVENEDEKCPSGYTCVADVVVGKNVCIKEDNIPRLDQGTPDCGVVQVIPTKDGSVLLDQGHCNPPKSSLGCDDESSEPNNGGDTATALTAQIKLPNSLITGWEICYAGDVDQYTIKVDPGKTLTVKVIFTHSKGDLDAALLLPDGYVQGSRSTTNDEVVSSKNDETTAVTYTLGVWGHNLDTNKYDLDITIQ